jgi:cyclophilin family peptidyl-prolyl cis-trans isomerase
MRFSLQRVAFAVVILTACAWAASASGQGAEPAAADAAVQAKAAFDKAFGDYKEVIRKIEQMRVDYQTADAPTRQRINNELSGHLAHAQTLMNALVETAIDAFRLAPNGDPQITDLLVAVARHYVVGQQLGPPEPIGPGETFTPIEGGEQYERALPIIRRLIDGGVNNRELYVWGFLAAFVTNEYDLADTYLKKAQETGAIDALANAARGPQADKQAAQQSLLEAVGKYAGQIDNYRQLWAKESAIRAAEAAADNLPRVRLTTTKGAITIELFENEAPQSVANFITLVKQGYYDGSPFHRVLPKFMAQGGAKTDDGDGGPPYTIRCECYKPDYRHHFRGSLSMAHRGRDTGSSQFFLTFVPTTHLDGGHTVFGRVIEGMEVLGDIQRRSPQQARPPKADRILKAEVLRDRGHEYKFEKLPQ